MRSMKRWQWVGLWSVGTNKLRLRIVVLQVLTHHRIMKGLRQLLSDSLAVFLRFPACSTTSRHTLTVIEEMSNHQPFDHLPDQRSPGDNEAVSTVTMSPPPGMSTPSSYLQSSFDLTLREYLKETGIDLIRHPFAASLDNIDDVNTTIAALRERSRVSSDPQAGYLVAQMVNQLRSITHIVSLLSPTEALSDNIDLVCLRKHDSHFSYGPTEAHFVAVLT